MNKNQKNSLILVVVIIAVFILAYFGYNKLSQKGPGTSNVPTINVDESRLSDLESKSKTIPKAEKAEKAEIDQKDEEIKSQEEIKDATPLVAEVKEMAEDSVTSEDNKDFQEDAKAEESDEVQEEAEDQSSIMPDIPLILLNGEETTFWQLAEKGKPVVINLFASWCPPCRSEMPDFVEASQEYENDVTFVFFDSFDGTRETVEKVEAFAKEYSMNESSIVLDPGYISYLFQSNSLPTTIIINKEGVPAFLYQGMISKETLTLAIDQLLAE